MQRYNTCPPKICKEYLRKYVKFIAGMMTCEAHPQFFTEIVLNFCSSVMPRNATSKRN
jgi:hypothetical protein